MNIEFLLMYHEQNGQRIPSLVSKYFLRNISVVSFLAKYKRNSDGLKEFLVQSLNTVPLFFRYFIVEYLLLNMLNMGIM